MRSPVNHSLVGKAFGKGTIVATGDEAFGEDGAGIWVLHEPCRGPNCLHPNATHLVKQTGEMKGYCCACSNEVTQAREASEQARAGEKEDDDDVPAILSYGNGVIVSKGVNDGAWNPKPRCIAPGCKQPTAWFLVKVRGPWKGHCTQCVLAFTTEGRAPTPFPARDESNDAWQTRPVPGAKARERAESMGRDAAVSATRAKAARVAAAAKEAREHADAAEIAASAAADEDAALHDLLHDVDDEPIARRGAAAAPRPRPTKEGDDLDDLHDLLHDVDSDSAEPGSSDDMHDHL